jgi:hypothetical protein
MRKLFSVVLSLLLVLSGTQMTAKASSEQEKVSFSNLKEVKLTKANKHDKIFLESDGYQKYLKENPGSKVVTKEQQYYKLEQDENGEIIRKQCTPSEYNLQVAKEDLLSQSSTYASVSLTKPYGWISVTIYGVVNSSNNYYLAFSYNWDKVPFFASTDAVVLGAAEALPINFTTITAQHHVVAEKQYNYSYDYLYYDMKNRGTNTFGLNVPLRVSSYGTSDAWGIIGANASRQGSGIDRANIWGSYGHREITVSNFSFSFSASGCSFGFPTTPTYDEAPVVATFEVY